MPPEPFNLSYIEKLKGIKELLKRKNIDRAKYRRYFLNLNRIYPKIIETFSNKSKKDVKDLGKKLGHSKLTPEEQENIHSSWENFLEIDPNKKANFLMDFAIEQYEARKKKEPNGNFRNFRNTELRIIWGVQGLLGKIGQKYKANHELLETQTSNTNLELPITLEDVEKLYDVLPYKYGLMLKIITFTGLNPKDVLGLQLSNFKKTHNPNFYFIQKMRNKTAHQQVEYILVFDENFYQEIENFTKTIPNYSKNDPIFDITPSTLLSQFKFYIKKYNLNPKILPKYIRQLCYTLLSDEIPEKLLLAWSQHKPKLMDKHYIKKTVDKMIEFYPRIARAFLLKSSAQYAKEIRENTNIKQINQLKKELQRHFIDKTNKRIEELKAQMQEKDDQIGELHLVIEQLNQKLNENEVEYENLNDIIEIVADLLIKNVMEDAEKSSIEELRQKVFGT